MFDWDRDYEDVVQNQTIRVRRDPDENGAAKPWYWQSLASRIVLPAVAAVGIMVALFMGNQWVGSATATTQISAAIFGSGSVTPAQQAITMPSNMRVYEQADFDRFMVRMASISDTDLVQYSHAMQRDLGDGMGVMAPYQTDALTLTRLEMTRRGLLQSASRPTIATPAIAVADNSTPPAAALILQATAPLITTD